MSYELIICEKPNAAQKIALALADGKPVKKSEKSVSWWLLSHNKKDLVVAAAAGHLYGLGQKGGETYTYPSFEVEWKPNSELSKGAAFTKKYVTVLKKLAKEATEFTIATDYDIEGETIGYNILRFACKAKDASRMKYSTLTKEELVQAYEEKSPTIDWGQAHAGETRHELDWLYGINLSRALTQSVKAAGAFKVLSIGRVQGPALKLVVEREAEIKAFKPVPYWQLELETVKGKNSFSAWHVTNKFWSEVEAQTAEKRAKNASTAIVQGLSKKAFKQQPPSPFDLGSLQTEAYRSFKIRPKETLQHAQSLYSNGYISYPRTSSQQLPAKIGYEKVLKALSKQATYAPLAEKLLNEKTLKPKNGKKTDPAHPAIYPSGQLPGELKTREGKVYDLIVKRFLATFGEPAERETVTANILADSEGFIAKGTRTTKPGWHEYYAPYVQLKEEELPALKEKEELPIKKLTLHAKETQPPKRYTQASIINELEKRNLGTKATRADIVEALYNRSYVKGDSSIEATELGIQTIETLGKHSPEIIDEELTKHFEGELEEIREKHKKGPAVIDEAKATLSKILGKFQKKEKEIGKELLAAKREEEDRQNTLGECPKCKEGNIRVTYSKKTRKRFLGCTNYPNCDQTYPLPQKGVIKPTEKTCEECGAPLAVFGSGRRAQTLCVNNECPAKLKAEKAAEKAAGGEQKKCPKCGKDLVLRKSVYGAFWGCTGFPKCRHTENAKKE